MNIFKWIWIWWKSHTFNGKIQREVGSVTCESGRAHSTEIKILLLEPKLPVAEQRIELQLIMKASMGYQNTPVLLSRAQAEGLINLLREAIA